MQFEFWTIYAAIVLVLLMNKADSGHLLMLSNSKSQGVRRSLATMAGKLSANALQMLAAGLGLAAVLAVSDQSLKIVKWIGIAYLIWLGIKMIRKAKPNSSGERQAPASLSLRALWRQGFDTLTANPMAIVFFAALFVQFVQAQSPFWPQFLILSATYIVMDGLFLLVYGILGQILSQDTDRD